MKTVIKRFSRSLAGCLWLGSQSIELTKQGAPKNSTVSNLYPSVVKVKCLSIEHNRKTLRPPLSVIDHYTTLPSHEEK